MDNSNMTSIMILLPKVFRLPPFFVGTNKELVILDANEVAEGWPDC